MPIEDKIKCNWVRITTLFCIFRHVFLQKRLANAKLLPPSYHEPNRHRMVCLVGSANLGRGNASFFRSLKFPAIVDFLVEHVAPTARLRSLFACPVRPCNGSDHHVSKLYQVVFL